MSLQKIIIFLLFIIIIIIIIIIGKRYSFQFKYIQTFVHNYIINF
jgi:hypothetical protein